MLAGSVGRRDADVLPTVPDVLGRPARTFASCVEDHREAFTPA